MTSIGASSSNRHVATADRAALDAFYGHRCALTKGALAIDETYIIPHKDSYRVEALQAIAKMRNRGLIPQNMTLASSKNLIPLQATFRRAYGGHLWAFLPTEPVLLAHIAFEEHHLCRRQTTHPDPGRLPYDRSYLHFSPDANFNAYFVDNFEPFLTHDNGHSIVRHPSDLFPVRQLIASVNIVVSQAPTFIGDLGNVEAARTMSLVMYLRALWAASPATFRQLQRPRLIDFEIDRAEAYFETVPASIKGGSIGENETGEVPYTNNNVVDELVIDTPKLDVHVPGDRYEFPNSASDGSSLQLSDEEFEDNVGCSRLTANDRAFLKYGTILGGPVLNFE